VTNVRYEVSTDLGSVISCNCSICSKKGSLLTFVPVGEFKLLAGEDAQKDYQFNKNVIHHLFCKNCGIASFSRGAMPDGTKIVAINVRCLEGVDPSSLQVTAYDGRSK
jgi:hypothetical protein